MGEDIGRRGSGIVNLDWEEKYETKETLERDF